MAIVADTTLTFDVVGIREDLADIIYNIAPTETPFMSNVGKGTTKGTFHEWQIDDLDAVTDNKKLEGDVATNLAITPTTRVGNYTQIADKVIQISGSDQVADNAGRATEMAYQMAKRGQELKRDMETTLIGTAAKFRVAGNSTTERELGPVLSWVATNESIGSGGVAPTGDGTDARTDGTPRTFSEPLLTAVIDDIFLAGGDPSIIMANTQQKRLITGFTGNATKFKEVDDKKIINAVDVYVSDYGELMVVPNRFQRQRDVWLLDPDMWSVDFYRDFSTHDLAKVGDSERKQMIVEYTLTSKQEASSGGVFDLTVV